MQPGGFVDYKRREYCKGIKCRVQELMDKKPEGSQEYEALRGICKEECLHTAYEFHHWLDDNGFLVVKPKV